MGKYLPSPPRRKRSVTSALTEAEEDHLLDCPNADFFIRLGAFLLDLILLTLILAGIRHLQIVSASVLDSFMELRYVPMSWGHSFRVLSGVVFGLFRLWFFYLYVFWTTTARGGTPAKLLMGLRVVDQETGRNLSFPRMIVREMIGKPAGLIPMGYGILMALFRKDKRTFHDLLSRSVVKRVHGSL